MAGIHNAKKLKKEKKDSGVILSKGVINDNEDVFNFIIIKLDNDNGFITQYDYNSDLNIDKNIKNQDRVELIIKDNYSAIWTKEK